MVSVRSRAFWAGLVALSALPVSAAVVLVLSDPGPDDPGRVPARLSKRSENEEKIRSSGRWQVYDAFPPLFRIKAVTAAEVGSAIADDEFVLGVEVEGEARAYPLNMMGHPGSEVVNDTLGGQPVAVTFCGLCETPLVFSRRVDDRTLTFYVSGVVIDSNMLIKDVETRSEWVQLLGKAVGGPFEGKELQQYPAVWVDWKTWRAEHPGTTAVLLARGSRKYSISAVRATASRGRALDALQWGLSRGGKARSWPFSRLARRPVVNDSFAGLPLLIVFDPESFNPTGFDRRLGERELTFRRRGTELIDETTGSVWDPVTGEALRGALAGRRLSPVAGTIATASTWRAFHPDTEVWDAGGPAEPSPGPIAQ